MEGLGLLSSWIRVSFGRMGSVQPLRMNRCRAAAVAIAALLLVGVWAVPLSSAKRVGLSAAHRR